MWLSSGKEKACSVASRLDQESPNCFPFKVQKFHLIVNKGPKVPSNSEQKAKSKHLLDCNVKTPHGSIDRSITLPANLRLHKMINNQNHHEAHYHSGPTGSCSNTLLCFVTVTQVFHIEANSIVSALVLFVDTFVLRLNVKMCFIMWHVHVVLTGSLWVTHQSAERFTSVGGQYALYILIKQSSPLLTLGNFLAAIHFLFPW